MQPNIDNKLKFLNLKIDLLDTHPKNPNTHSKANLNEIAASINSVGYIDPLVVRPYNNRYQILAGEGRFLACKMNGLTQIPVICVELSDEQALAYMVASNEIPRSSEINAGKFEEIIHTLNSIDPNFNWNSIGLSDQEAGALLNFDVNVINDGDPKSDLHDGIKEKVKPLRLSLEQRAFLEYVIEVYNEVAEEPAPHETEAIMFILSDWVASVSTNGSKEAADTVEDLA